MTTPKDHRPVITGDDMLRGFEKRLGHEERRPRIGKASDLLGPGFAPHAVQLLDWNSPTARFNGLWFSEDALNAPTPVGVYVGMTIAAQQGHGTQIATTHTTPMVLWMRTLHTHPAQAPSYSPWEQVAPAPAPYMTGMMIGWPTAALVPAGWIPANGDQQPRASYPALAAVLGVVAPTVNFTLPNVAVSGGMRTIIKT